MSELERDNSVHRMVEARWNKARRGEVFTAVPAGYDVDETGQVLIASDETVADAIRRAFAKFDELGTARQVFVWWQQEDVPFPVRQTAPGARRVAWVSVSYRAILETIAKDSLRVVKTTASLPQMGGATITSELQQ